MHISKELVEAYQINDINELARVITVHKESYIVQNTSSQFRAEITGNLRYTAQNNEDLPCVGDWVRIVEMDKDSAIILEVLERHSVLKRKAVGKSSETQMIAVNIDCAFVCMAFNQDFKINRLDRFISICNAGNITPIILLSKSDLITDEEKVNHFQEIKHRHPQLEILDTSIENEASLITFQSSLKQGKTYCFVGSSGVGKSTLVNYLLGNSVLKISELSESTQKGKHTTSHRELFELPNGCFVIDTPGMREVGITDSNKAISTTFSSIHELEVNCKYADCTHTSELGCAVLEGINSGLISEEEYNSYLKLRKEEEHYAASVQDKKRQSKNLSKLIKQVKAKDKRNY